ncbi:hypothetical protein JRO89_XS10G0070700 [Xanthoceras sorbifolium]|uniref:Uncharacterized protein n=1 Tax=Xanthoceras sorbifolium TaxID=99658 RepID=A0ABQ8HHY2_9ROSI|nr:hypothetical protein JRO89_XS10G0070700 [Xanthoceras sorbifolium]
MLPSLDLVPNFFFGGQDAAAALYKPEYVEEYKVKEGKSFGVSASLCNKDNLDMNKRGNKATIDGHERLKWPDSEETSSVVYACLGSPSDDIEKWILEEGFEQRIKGRGHLVRGLGWVGLGNSNKWDKEENVKRAVDKLMDDGEDHERKAKRAVEAGGSSQLNTMKLIQDVMQHLCSTKATQFHMALIKINKTEKK